MDLSCLQCPHSQSLMISTPCQSRNYASSLVSTTAPSTLSIYEIYESHSRPVALNFLLDHSLSNPPLLTLWCILHHSSPPHPVDASRPCILFPSSQFWGSYNAEQFICPKLYFKLPSPAKAFSILVRIPTLLGNDSIIKHIFVCHWHTLTYTEDFFILFSEKHC